MNKKILGASLRRGVLTGTVAGFVAGWLAFVGHGKELDAAQLDAWQQVQDKTAGLVLPPIPGLPQLPPVPAVRTYPLRYGPDGPLPRVTIDGSRASGASAPPIASSAPRVGVAATAAPTGPVPTFAPLPPLPPLPTAPAPTTRSSPPHK
jgi:hypothetical protein